MTTTTKSTPNGSGAATSVPTPEQSIQLTPLAISTYEIPIRGVSPLIVHKWSEKALQMMRDKQSGNKARKKLDPKEPEKEAEASTYRLEDGRPGMPASAFKAAIIGAARLFDGLTLVETKQLIRVTGEGGDQLVPIEGDSYIREDTPRIGMGTADLRYRRCFPEWSAVLPVTFLSGRINLESVLALVNAAGTGGVGEWRPSAPKSLSGTFGCFEVVTDAEIKQVQ